jgi:hypothetical protein
VVAFEKHAVERSVTEVQVSAETGAIGQRSLTWLTVERAAYGGAVLVALLFRLLLLGASPLGPSEAAQALPALAASTGREFSLVGISPLLFGLQRLVFVLFGASDVWARWWPALFGGLAVLLYYPLRGPLGRSGALVAAYLWAISPLAVFASRLGLGYGLVPVLALALIAAVAWAVRKEAANGRRTALVLAGATAGLLLASGPGAYTVAVIGLAAVLVWRRSLVVLVGSLKASWRQVVGVTLLCFVLGSTFLLMVPSGLAAAADLLGSWLANLRPGRGEYAAWEILARLALSEPVLLGFGLAGMVAALRRGDRFGRFAAVFAGLALLISFVGSGRHPADLALVVLPLCFLAGPAIARVLESVWPCRRDLDAWLLVVVSTVLLLTAALCLPSALNPSNTANWRQLYSAVGIVTLALSGLVWLVYGAWGNWRTVAIALPIVPLMFGLAWGLGELNGINHDRGAGRQPGVLHFAPAPGWTDLRSEVLDLASLLGTGRGEAQIDLVLPATETVRLGPSLQWALRAFPNVRLASTVSPVPAPIVITLPGEQPRLSSGYSGTEIAVLRQWAPSSLTDFYSRLRWVLYRESEDPGQGLSVVLWVQRPTQPAESSSQGASDASVPSKSGMIQ